MRYSQKLKAILSVAFVIVVVGSGTFRFSKGEPLFVENSAGVVADTARHLWVSGNIQNPRFQELYDELIERSRGIPRGSLVQDFFSIGSDGNLYPKHSILFAALSAVFYGVFGEVGFWILVQVGLFALLAGVYRLSRRASSALATAIALIATPLSTNFLQQSLAFTYSFFAPACVVWSLVLLPRTPLVAGLVFSLSFYLRISHLALLPMLLLAYQPLPSGRITHYAKVLSGVVMGWIPLLVLNHELWGAPLRGAYTRLPVFGNGHVTIDTGSHTFALEFLTRGWRHRLFDNAEGLLATSPIWYLLPLMVWIVWKHPHRRFLASLLAGACGYTVLMLTFSYWETANGTRFVFPCTALLFVLAAALFDRIMTPPRHNAGPIDAPLDANEASN